VLAELLHRQAGIITRGQALDHLSAKAIEHRLATGRWRRIHHGVYATHTGPLGFRERVWIAVLAVSAEPGTAYLAGLHALCTWGLRGIEPAAIDVLVPHGRRPGPPAGVRVRRSGIAFDQRPDRWPPSTGPGRSLVDAAQWARSDREARLITAASFQQRVVNLPQVRRAATALTTARRRALVLETAADCASGSHSLGELDFLALCRRSGLPTPTRQAVRSDGRGQRFLDAAFDPWKVAVEIDGAHHLDVARMWDDAVRGNALELDGYTVLRYPAYAVRREPRRIAAEIRRALRQAGWPGGSGDPYPPGGVPVSRTSPAPEATTSRGV